MIRNLCPFCMKKHSLSYCHEKNQTIPRSFQKAVKKNIPVFYLFTIGYSGHGKTCFLSSLFYSFYHFFSSKWEEFSFLGLNQETLEKIHKTYVNVLEQLKVPAKTPIMFPSPLILKMQQMPIKKKSLFSGKIKLGEAVFVFYDIGGGTFEVDKKIEENLPILENMDSLIFLVDIPGLIHAEGKVDYLGADRNLHNLLNVIYNTLDRLGQKKQKNLILCFTKADLMLHKEELYGPLALWEEDIYDDELPTPGTIDFYTQELILFSKSLEGYFMEHFPIVYNTLNNNFKKIFFSVFSALGSQPDKGVLNTIEPKRIFDPIFINMMMDKYL